MKKSKPSYEIKTKCKCIHDKSYSRWKKREKKNQREQGRVELQKYLTVSAF